MPQDLYRYADRVKHQQRDPQKSGYLDFALIVFPLVLVVFGNLWLESQI
jgi:hypothetical protein